MNSVKCSGVAQRAQWQEPFSRANPVGETLAVNHIELMHMRIYSKIFLMGLLAVQIALQAAYGQTSQAGSATKTPSATLEGSNWQLVKITVVGGFEFIPQDRGKYVLNFRSENRLTGTSDCNQITGTWHQEGDALRFEPFSTSRSLCEPGSLHNTLALNLRSVQAMTKREGNLILTTDTAGVELEFESRD